MTKHSVLLKAAIAAMCLPLWVAASGCGGGGGGSGVSTPNTGVFVDAPVQGLAYSTPTQAGQTDSSGTFKYLSGETVTFKVGDVTVGSATGAQTITPVTLGGSGARSSDTNVVNVASFLQSLDSNGGTGTVLQIPDAAHTALKKGSANDSSVSTLNSATGFTTGYASVVNDTFVRTISGKSSATAVSASTAQKNMEAYLQSKGIPLTNGTASTDNTSKTKDIPLTNGTASTDNTSKTSVSCTCKTEVVTSVVGFEVSSEPEVVCRDDLGKKIGYRYKYNNGTTVYTRESDGAECTYRR